MSYSYRLLPMVQVNMICEICDKKAFVWTYDGEKYCANCTKKEWKWNNDTMRYE